MSALPVPLVDAQGTHHEIGVTIGRAVPDRIAGMVRSYRQLFAQSLHLNLTWAQAVVRAQQYLPYIQAALPSYLDELRGMAEGSGEAWEDLFVCNCFEELTSDLLFEKCTIVAFAPEHTREGHVLLGHTEDWLPVDRPWQYVVRVWPDDEPPFLAAVYGGLLANVGLNGAGLAQCINSMYPTDVRPGVPRVFIGRHVLTAPRLGVAIERALHPQRAAGYNHVLADESGELYSLETTAQQFDLRYAQAGHVAHANHYVSERLRALEDQPEQLTGSHVRANRADRLAR
ncbi:MAG TPA: C45 family peptidase [Anaerolineae bacterium]|nr:C45 family peptidase [Anaerolineae bacterium]